VRARVRPQCRRRRPREDEARDIPGARPARRLRLKPVQQAEAELSRGIVISSLLGAIHTHNGPEPVVVLRPVHNRDITARKAVLKIAAVQYTAVAPPRVITLGIERTRVRGSWVSGRTVVQLNKRPGHPGGWNCRQKSYC
jgi:hypothetical protein